ncbi:hypothetical protein COLO4_22937 [Corchorus olitorius]|uniref:DUF962 domain-containing protein n=1 Tax=Corchorus olitorius TaxID=93759 RepID=A0A1R3IIS6_9ROSI|nr:hypothetical protein COLO4_22937 [Corchorus olitorius]
MGNKIFDLEKNFSSFGAYHSNPINIAIHMLFSWPIFFTAILLLDYTPPLFNLPTSTFLFLEAMSTGTLAALLCWVCWIGSNFLATRLRFSLAWKIVLVAQVVGWTGLSIGHGVFEGRAPALLDNLAQGLIMGPYFVLFEALQKFFGYEPYPGFHASAQTMIEAEINEWREKKQK